MAQLYSFGKPIMTTEEAVFRGVIYGGIFTLSGTLLANCFQVFIQWRLQKWSIEAEKKKSFAQKRLGALQGTVQLCDFLVAAKGVDHLGVAAMEDWNRIRRETITYGGLMPASIQKEFQAILSPMLVLDRFATAESTVEIDAVARLRSLCLAAIQEEYGK